MFVGLELVEGISDPGVLISQVLEFEDCQGQAIQEDHHVRAAIILVLNHRELVYREPVVIVRVLEIKKLYLIVSNTVVFAVLDVDSLCQEFLKTPIAFL